MLQKLDIFQQNSFLVQSKFCGICDCAIKILVLKTWIQSQVHDKGKKLELLLQKFTIKKCTILQQNGLFKCFYLQLYKINNVISGQKPQFYNKKYIFSLFF